MIFITEADIDVLIRGDMLQNIINGDSLLLNKAEKSAIKKVRSYLMARYDMDDVFSQTGDDRDELIMEHVIDIMLYTLHSRINPRKIPKLRYDRYKDAVDWLKMVQQGETSAELPPIPNAAIDQTGSDEIKWGSNEAQDHYF